MPSAGFEPATPETRRPQTYVLDCAATEVGNFKISVSETILRHILSFDVFVPDVTIEWLTPLLHTWDIQNSSFGSEAGYPDIGFS
jgi:hypothetical protein